MNYILYMMGGIGSRFKGEKPKQFAEVEGKPIFINLLDQISSFDVIKGIVIVCQPDWIDYTKEILKKNRFEKIIEVVAGGSTRTQSVKNGLNFLYHILKEEDIVLIHDATHPYIDKPSTLKLIDAISITGAGSLVNFVFDTAYKIGKSETLVSNFDRKEIAIGASPEGFKFGILYKIFSENNDDYLNSMTSIGALMIDNGVKMSFIETKFPSLKITFPEDLEIYKSLLNYFNKH